MSVQTLQTAMYKAVMGLLVDSPALYSSTGDKTKVRVGSLLRRDTTAVCKDNILDARGPGDFPEMVVLWGPARLESYGEAQRYAYSSGTKPTGTVKTLVQGFRITLTHAAIKADANDPIVAAAIDALEGGGPGLGLVPSVVPYAVRGTINIETTTGTVTRPVSGKTDTTPREQVTLSFDVTVRWKGEPLPTVAV